MLDLRRKPAQRHLLALATASTIPAAKENVTHAQTGGFTTLSPAFGKC